jgi:DNA-directed RNA polymerase subunit M/transcription elongation factor TFIIS
MAHELRKGSYVVLFEILDRLIDDGQWRDKWGSDMDFDDWLDRFVHDMETGIFNCAIDRSAKLGISCNWSHPGFSVIYRALLRSVASNIDSESYVDNKSLLNRLLDPADPLLPHDVPFMHASDSFPDRWVEVMHRSQKRDRYIIEKKPIATTDIFRCARCKGRECSYTELQTRSCDEPASIFVTCHGCGNRWRIG